MKNKIIKTLACLLAGLTLTACVGSVNVPAGTENKITDGTMDTTMDKSTAMPLLPNPITATADSIYSIHRLGTFSRGDDINDDSDDTRNYTNSKTQDTFKLVASGDTIIMIVNGVTHDLTLDDSDITSWSVPNNEYIYIFEPNRTSNDLRATLAGKEGESILGTYVYYHADTTIVSSGLKDIPYDFTLGYAVVGIPTPASTVASQTATATYTGLMEFETLASHVTDIASQDSRIYYAGEVELTMTVNFTINTVAGTGSIERRGAPAGAIIFAPAPIVGNGFEGVFTLDGALRTNAGLTNNPVGNYKGNFFGPNADDLAGVLRFNSANAHGNVNGLGGFRGDRQDN